MIARMLRNHLIGPVAVLAFLLAPLTAFAQESGGPFTARVLAFERVGDIDRLQVAYGEDKPGPEIEIHTNNFTGPYELKERNFTLMSGEKVAARVAVPVTGKKVLLILVPSPRKDRLFVALSTPDSRTDFGPGERKLVNLTKWEIAGRLEKEAFRLPSAQVVKLPSVGKPNERHKLSAEFFFREKEKDEWTPFTSTYWQHDPETRGVVFFYRQPGRQTIRIKGITEFLSSSGRDN